MGSALAVLIVVWVEWNSLRSWYVLWSDFEYIGLNGWGFPEYRHRQTDIVFVRLPSGTFNMGSSEENVERTMQLVKSRRGFFSLPEQDRKLLYESRDAWLKHMRQIYRRNERLHRVSVTEFLISEYEVTQAQWRAVMRASPSEDGGDELPVQLVSWEDCAEFCRRAGFQLPREAQWEYACRAGTETLFHFGDTPGEDSFCFDRDAPCPVGSFEPNPFGLHDMHGNVSEFCVDVYDRLAYSRPAMTGKDPVCEHVDPTSMSDGTYRVVRGGDYLNACWRARSANRGPGWHASMNTGLRLVFSLNKKP